MMCTLLIVVKKLKALDIEIPEIYCIQHIIL
jgi:hypothetical protein